MALEVDIEKQAGDFHLKAAFSCGEEFLGILGPSGCGKSMTLKCIAGIERPDRGRIVLDGRILFDSEKKINLTPQQRHVGYLFQNCALFPNMTLRQNILCGLHGEKDRVKKEREADRILDLLQIRDIQHLRPAQLSGGQAQRAALGRILVNRPQLLMLDEPFSALDTHLRLKLQMDLKELLAGYGRGILMVTHDRGEAFRMCGKIGVMTHGRMLAVKKTKELFADPGSRQAAALTGCKNIVTAEKTGEYEVFVPEWDIRLVTGTPVRDSLRAIGIRAHYFNPKTPVNSFPVRFGREMEEPFEWVSEFRYERQDPSSPAVWWRYAKDKRLTVKPERLGVAPANILLLYDE
ncbi:MAG: ATP-binding cassette domain-containing protein [Lachnospiraceae bacterium]|nr:ATP-binding cassette domain-containing protein [Lachnospiraceae bacterium]